MSDISHTNEDGSWKYTDITQSPPEDELIKGAQVWVWMNGPNGGHYEVRGLGVVWNEDC